MKQGRPRSMRMNALLALVAGAAQVSHPVQGNMKPDARPVAVYLTTQLARERRGQYQVPNKTKRGLRRRQTRRR